MSEAVKETVKVEASKGKEPAYAIVEVMERFEVGGRHYVLHERYNPLINCSILSDYDTGYSLTAFGNKPKETNDEARIRLSDHCLEWLKNATEKQLQVPDHKPVINTKE